MATRTIAIIRAVTTMQAIVVLVLAIFMLTHSFCWVNVLHHTANQASIKLIYLHEPAYCGTRINIGKSVDALPDQAFVIMERTPFTYKRTFYFNWAGFTISIVWLISNELLFRTQIRIAWIFVTMLMCAMDLTAIISYLSDSYATQTLSELMAYIGASAFGLGNAEVDTASVSVTMALVMSKCGVFFLINFVLLVLLSLDRNGNGNNNIEPEAASTPPSTRNTKNLQRRLPRPHFRRECAATVLRATNPVEEERQKRGVANSSFVDHVRVHSSGIHGAGRSKRNKVKRAMSAEDARIKVRVPDRLLSLPQRLEKLMIEESRRVEAAIREGSETSAQNKGNGLARTESNREAQRSEARGAAPGVYFPEMLHTLPRKLETIIEQQRRSLDAYSFNVHSAQDDRLSASLPNLSDGIKHHTKTEPYENYLDPLWVWRGFRPWQYEPAPESRLSKQLQPRLDSKNVPPVLDKNLSMYREDSVHLTPFYYDTKDDIRRMVFYRSQRDQPDVLY